MLPAVIHPLLRLPRSLSTQFSSSMMFSALVVLAVALLCSAHPAGAQVADNPQELVEYAFDSGSVRNTGDRRQVIYSTTVHIKDASWMRLYLDVADLGRPRLQRSRPTELRLTSLKDGAVQILNPTTLQQWRRSSAYFNGDRVRIEIIADPGAAPSRIAGSRVLVGPPGPLPVPRTICGNDDDRVQAVDPRTARTSNGCTAWLIDDAERCLLTAGHCDGSQGGALTVIMFNVPDSNSNGTLNNSHPDDQYAVDPDSIQSTGESTPGNEYTYFGVFPNSNTGLTPAEAQGDFFQRATPPSTVGATLRITGYGSTLTTELPNSWNQTLLTHTGPLYQLAADLRHRVDTTGGNSGSPIIEESTGKAVGIHTHGGCTSSSSTYNSGTMMNFSPLTNAINNPLGVCITPVPEPPVNDECANAIPIFDGETDFNSTGATDSGPLHLVCNFNGDAQIRSDIWYLYTATCTDTLVVSTCNNALFVTKIAVYEGSVCPVSIGDAPIACIDDTEGCLGGTTHLTVPVQQGEVYLIRIGSRLGEHAQTGPGTLTIQCGDPPPPCPGDANGDGVVNVEDLLMVISNWGSSGPDGDVNGDGAVNVQDLLEVISNWGSNCN